MDNFLTILKRNGSFNYNQLSSYYSDLRQKDSNKTITSEDKSDLNLLTNVFVKNDQIKNPMMIDKGLFDKLAQNDGDLSYSDFTSLRHYDYKNYTQVENSRYKYLYAPYDHILNNNDIGYFKEEIPKNPLSSDYYFDDDDNFISSDAKMQKENEELEKMLSYIRSHDVKFKDANGKEINAKDVLKKYEDLHGTFKISDGQDMQTCQTLFTMNDSSGKSDNSFQISINSKKNDLFSLKNVDAKSKLNMNFFQSVLHELMHFNDLNVNYNFNVDSFISKSNTLKREAYAEKTAVIAVETIKNPDEDPDLKDYSIHEEWFLKRYK